MPGRPSSREERTNWCASSSHGEGGHSTGATEIGSPGPDSTPTGALKSRFGGNCLRRPDGPFPLLNLAGENVANLA